VGCGGGSSSKNTVPNELLDPGGHVVDPNDSTPPVTEPPDDTPAPTLAAITPEKACERLKVHRGEGCSWANRFPPEIEREDVCLRSMNQWFAPETEGHQALQKTASCWALDCEGAEACMVRIQSQKPPPPPRKCGDEGVGNVVVDKSEFAKRNGVNVTRFADAKSSEQQPIEVCGIDGEVEWMTRATCNGGKHPFENAMAANSRRDSYVKNGGRCNSILDRYTVECPEETYTVFVDRYICPAP
jgi:hypothetical protein